MLPLDVIRLHDAAVVGANPRSPVLSTRYPSRQALEHVAAMTALMMRMRLDAPGRKGLVVDRAHGRWELR